MKGLKFYALLGMVATAAFTAPKGLAWDEAAANRNSDERAMRLDELFKRVLEGDKQATAASPTGAPKHAQAPRMQAHHQVASAVKQNTASKNQLHVVAKQPQPEGSAKLSAYKAAGTGVTALSVAQVSDNGAPVVEAALDHSRTHGGLPCYKPGDNLVVNLKANRDCNVLVLDYDSQGMLTQLFPNAYEKDATLHQGQTYSVGGADCPYNLSVSGKGQERIFVYAYPTSEGAITLAMNPVPNTPFRGTAVNRQQYDRLLTESRSYFDESARHQARSVTVVPKRSTVSAAEPVKTPTLPPNKVELVFQIENQ